MSSCVDLNRTVTIHQDFSKGLNLGLLKLCLYLIDMDQQTPADGMKDAHESSLRILCGICPDEVCKATLYFQYTQQTVECHRCGQIHTVATMSNIHEADSEEALSKMINHYYPSPKKGTDFIKVNGLSNFRCKLLSPFLTIYGMDRMGNAKLLKDLGHSETIDCGKVLGCRSFLISPAHINIEGYGKDRSGSLKYLEGFLDILKEFHKGEERLVPIHVDGDGHCLVHALSRALIGRELFWHSLRKNLHDHLKNRLSDYMELFKDFHDKEDWDLIIEEADPYCVSGGVTAGLGNMHIFALSNILKRPIMLFDSPQKMKNPGDYTGLFVPALTEPSECKNRSPLCVAWSGPAHNHFVPLVPVEGRPLPHIPCAIIPGLWGVSQETASKYLNYNADGSLTVCDGKPLNNSYLQKLTTAMEKVFQQHHDVAAFLVEDLCRCVYRPNELPGLRPEDIARITGRAIAENRLFRCLVCKSLQESIVPEDNLAPGGELYNLVVKCHTCPKPNKLYSFPMHNVTCHYDPDIDMLVLASCKCQYCARNETRRVCVDGTICYENGDMTETETTTPTRCNCGQKHFWNGKEYDNLPKKFILSFPWGNRSLEAEVIWFYGESVEDLNSDPATEAQRIVDELFPVESRTGNLVDQITNIIIRRCNQLKILHKPLPLVNMYFPPSNRTEMSQSEHRETKLKTKHIEPESSVDKTEIQHMVEGESIPSTSNAPSGGPMLPILQLAYKRKSNGEPTTTANQPSCDQEPQEKDPKILIKISSATGKTKTLKVDQSIDMATLKEEVFIAFGIEHDKQILKYGFPPKLLHPSSNEASLGLKSGDKIKVDCKVPKPSEIFNKQAIQDKINKMKAAEVNSANKVSDLATKLLQLKTLQNESVHPTMWEYAIEKPELFHPGGFFYEHFEKDVGLKPGQHCIFPLLPNHRFQYNGQHDRVELCLEPAGHYPIDDEIKHVLKKHSHIQTLGHVSAYNQALLDDAKHKKKSPKDTSESSVQPRPVGNEVAQPKTTPAGPGYHTIGDVPADITTEEKSSQREGLMKLVQQIKDKQTSS